MKNADGCDPETLALIAAQFVAAGDDQSEALRKANALYLAASEYAKQFAATSVEEKAFEMDAEKALLDSADREDVAIGNSEIDSPALSHFKATATTKTEQNLTHKAFVNLIEREFGRRPEKIAPFALANMHSRLRVTRSRARSLRRQKTVK
jgi:hypothetical protein